MARLVNRSVLTVALLVVAALVALWLLRFVVGLVIGLAKLALVAAVIGGGAYVAYRLWRGWTGTGAEVEIRRR